MALRQHGQHGSMKSLQGFCASSPAPWHPLAKELAMRPGQWFLRPSTILHQKVTRAINQEVAGATASRHLGDGDARGDSAGVKPSPTCAKQSTKVCQVDPGTGAFRTGRQVMTASSHLSKSCTKQEAVSCPCLFHEASTRHRSAPQTPAATGQCGVRLP